MRNNSKMPVQGSKNFKANIKRVLGIIFTTYKWYMIAIIMFSLTSTLFSILGPKILGEATTTLFEGLIQKINGSGQINFSEIGKILSLVLILYIVSALFMSLQGWLMTTVSQKFSFKLRQQITRKINRLPMGYFEQRTIGDVLSRITNDVDTLGQGLNQSVTQLIVSVTTILGVTIMMLTISPIMTVVALVSLPLSGLLIGILTKASQKYFIQQQQSLGDVNGQVEESYAGQNVIVAFNHQPQDIAAFQEKNDSLYNSAWKSQFLSGLMFPVINFVGNLTYIGVVVTGSLLVASKSIGVGGIQAFIQYVRFFTQPVGQLAQVMNMLQSMSAAAERVFEFLDEAEEVAIKNEIIPTQKLGVVDFNHVQFGYRPEEVIINDFNVHVDKGQTVAIVGPTGAGKTTMVKLLMRFYDVNSGQIAIDNQPINQLARSALRDYFTMVLQETWLFKGTIMENIRYGRLEATDDEVIAAAKAAHAHHFIKTLPGCYQMELNEDATNISQGQRQLLTIARAILADKPILILDEATSSIDTRTEILIQEAMNRLMEGRTTFVIAHRLSTIKNADIILVLKDGDIIEQGNHEALLQQNGFYAELYNSQFAE